MIQMETVEVVIKIPKEDFDFIKDEFADGDMPDEKDLKETTYYAIANGTVLPKGHDALLDAGQLMDYCHNQIEGHKYVDCNVIARFPCVVKGGQG